MDIENLSLKSFNRAISNNQNSLPMCTNTKKFICITLSLAFISIDVLLNAFYVTKSFKKGLWLSEEHQGKYVFATSLIDIWIISLLRDLFLTTVVLWTIISHQKAQFFIKFVHKRYIGAFFCLLMYSFAMIKMLFYADQRANPDPNYMFMCVWNIFAGFVFFIEVYMFALIKPKLSDNYQKANIDGGDPGENPQEDDILIETLNEASKKRSSLFRLFKYSKSDLHLIAIASFFLLVGAVCK